VRRMAGPMNVVLTSSSMVTMLEYLQTNLLTRIQNCPPVNARLHPHENVT